MLIEIRAEGYDILGMDVGTQMARIYKYGKEYGVEVGALPYCLKDSEDDIYLGGIYKLKDVTEALKPYADVMDILNFTNEDIDVEVRYIVHELNVVEEVTYRSRLTGNRLYLGEMQEIIEDTNEKEYEGKGISNRLVQELMHLGGSGEYDPDRRHYTSYEESYAPYIDDSSKDISKERVQEDLWRGNIRKTLMVGEGLHTEMTEDGEFHIKMYQRNADVIPTEEKATVIKLQDDFSEKYRGRLRLLENYPRVDGYKYYHRKGEVYISLYSGEEQLVESRTIVFGLVHAVLETSQK